MFNNFSTRNAANFQTLQTPDSVITPRGLDMGAAAEVGRRLLEARARGAGVVLISEDLDEILGLADRIVVIRDGTLIEAKSHDREAIGLMMAGETV